MTVAPLSKMRRYTPFLLPPRSRSTAARRRPGPKAARTTPARLSGHANMRPAPAVTGSPAGSGIGSCVGTDGDRGDGQPGGAAEELPESLHLVVELAAVPRGQLAERLDREVKLPAGAAVMPHSPDGSVDEQHRIVPGLAARAQRAFSGPAGIKKLVWLAGHHVRVEVRQQPYPARGRGRRRAVPGGQPGRRPGEQHLRKLAGQRAEQLRGPIG